MTVFFGCKNELIDTPKNAEFKVEYYFQNILDDEFVINEEMTETLSGEIDSETKVICKEGEGFTASCEQQKINSDGSTVVKVYYSRNTYSINRTL